MKNDCLGIAIQKNGKLSQDSLDLFRKCDFDLRYNKSKFLVKDNDFGVELLMVRDDDIPELVANSVCDFGIVGENILHEFMLSNPSFKPEVIMPLGFGKCRLSIAAPINSKYKSLDDIDGLVIATSYRKSLENHLKTNNISAKVVDMSGSVEVAPKMGISDIICDLVSSGATLEENGLREIGTIFESQSVLIGRPSFRSENTDAKNKKISLLFERITGVLSAAKSKYIMLHIEHSKIDELKKILPGCESPTVLILDGIRDKVAVHIVSKQDIFWNTLEKLKSIGATSILVLPIEKMM